MAYIDRDNNLDLVQRSPTWLHVLWLEMLADPSVTRLTYSDLLSPKVRREISEYGVLSSGFEGRSLQCQLPFSWVIKEQMDELVHTATNMDRNGKKKVKVNIYGYGVLKSIYRCAHQ